MLGNIKAVICRSLQSSLFNSMKMIRGEGGGGGGKVEQRKFNEREVRGKKTFFNQVNLQIR